MNLSLEYLSRSTGFPAQVLSDFAERGLLPHEPIKNQSTGAFNGLALLRSLEELNRA